MSILEGTLKKIKEFGAKMRSGFVEDLIKSTTKAERDFVSEAKRLGIDVQNFNFRNYYDALGLKYTNDQKAIKAAYVRLIKEYHPDVSSDSRATQKTEEINEAYSVLKDEKKKTDYDSKFSKGKNRMSSDATRMLYNEFLRRYQEMRNKDFKEFNKRVANPQEINSLRATVEETVDWTRRFRQAKDITFGKFLDYGRKLKRLDAVNRQLMKRDANQEDLNRLKDNLAKLEGLVAAFDEAEKGISGVVQSAMNDIAKEENKITDKLRRSVS